MGATDVEINRALNALTTTLNDQRVVRFDTERAQQIVDGALAGERKLVVRAGEVTGTDGGRIATIGRERGRWVAERVRQAAGSDWALP